MSAAAADRRAEAHLWLLLEEALQVVRGGDVEPWEVWRNFRAVADALVAMGALTGTIADAFASELDDALAVRGVLPAGTFSAAPWPEVEAAAATASGGATGDATVWLEAEIERHLDLFASFGAGARGWAALDLVRILDGPVRAFRAVGLLGPGGGRILDEVVATLSAAGIEPGRPVAPETPPRPAWVEFLRSPPAPLPERHEPVASRSCAAVLGVLHGATVRLDRVAWSEAALELEVAVRLPVARVHDHDRAPWHARVADDAGRLHLGQSQPLQRGAGRIRFDLRPGLPGDARAIDVRITRAGERVEGRVDL